MRRTVAAAVAVLATLIGPAGAAGRAYHVVAARASTCDLPRYRAVALRPVRPPAVQQPQTTDVEFPPDLCSGVRPGARVSIAQSAWGAGGICSFGFMLTDAQQTRYMATAGHCVGMAKGGAPLVWNADGPRALAESASQTSFEAGRLVFAAYDDFHDFALVRLYPLMPASPAVCEYGGPIGVDTTTPGTPAVLHHYGAGTVLGSLSPARTAVAPSMLHNGYVFAVGVATPGDSGSPVLGVTGLAVGVLVGVGANLNPVTVPPSFDAGNLAIRRIPYEIDFARSRLANPTLQIVTAPLGPS